MTNKKARLIAFYLPQFHPTDLNDDWWGKGYTEWRNVTQARPLFRGHYQPHEPADLGYYDLRLPEIREQQAQMAKEAGIEGFCYWHYWMGNDTILLKRPFEEVLNSGKPDYPFCLGWANHDWTNKTWTKYSAFSKEKSYIKVFYSVDEYKKHFQYVLPAFKDKRYMTVDGKPIFYIWDTTAFPNVSEFINLWQDLARENGLNGIYFVGLIRTIGHFNLKGKNKVPSLDEYKDTISRTLNDGFDAINTFNFTRAEFLSRGKWRVLLDKILYHYFKIGNTRILDYRKMLPYLFVDEERNENIWPTVMPNWDRSPRAGKDCQIYTHTTPKMFRKALKQAVEMVKHKEPEHRVIIIKSWNEWGEGNHLEPDLKYGHQYLDVIKELMDE